MAEQAFRTELEKLINHQSMESGSNTPDFILADYLMNCLKIYDNSINRREKWYNREPHKVFGSTPEPKEVDIQTNTEEARTAPGSF